MILNDLKKAIHKWDRKSNSPLHDYCITFSNEEYSILKIKELLLIDERFQDATTWIIKYFLERNYVPSKNEIKLLVKLYPEFTSWAAKLHFLQFSVYLNFSHDQAMRLYHNFDLDTSNQNKFVRAWAFNAIFYLSSNYKFKTDATMLKLRKALTDESPSVKARIRNILRN